LKAIELHFVEKGLVNGSAKRRRRAIWTDIADTSDPVGKLRPRRERPRCCRAAEQRNELAALHSITSSARASRVGGTSSPSVLALFKLITRSYLVGCWKGRSPAFSPRRIRSTYDAARRYSSTRSVP